MFTTVNLEFAEFAKKTMFSAVSAVSALDVESSERRR